jgi:hypothetical protein
MGIKKPNGIKGVNRNPEKVGARELMPKKTTSVSRIKIKPSPSPTGKAAIKALQKQVSPKGVASMEKRAQGALDKMYPKTAPIKKSNPLPKITNRGTAK